jgi:hypothetical protein
MENDGATSFMGPEAWEPFRLHILKRLAENQRKRDLTPEGIAARKRLEEEYDRVFGV